MKTYLHLITLVSLLCWTACANKNVAVEETQQLVKNKTQIVVEDYDVNAVVNNICACLEERVKAAGLDTKKPLPAGNNLFKNKGNCEKKAYMEQGAPTSSNTKMEIETALKNKCGQYLNSMETSEKGVAKGKKEPIKHKKNYKAIPDLINQ